MAAQMNCCVIQVAADTDIEKQSVTAVTAPILSLCLPGFVHPQTTRSS
jgi:hypothetical protein